MEFFGFIIGIIVSILIATIIVSCKKCNRKKKGLSGCECDERQVLARGIAYKYAYFTFVAYEFITIAIREGLQINVVDEKVCMVIGVFLSLSVFVGICIVKSAYFVNVEQPRRFVVLFALIGIANLVGAVRIYMNEGILNQAGQFDNMNFVAAIFLFYVAFLLLFHDVIFAEQEED